MMSITSFYITEFFCDGDPGPSSKTIYGVEVILAFKSFIKATLSYTLENMVLHLQ